VQIDKSAASIAIESADGKYVYFARDKKLWQAKTDGSTAEQVAGMPEFNFLGMNGSRLKPVSTSSPTQTVRR
jgi:hypothetical protein